MRFARRLAAILSSALLPGAPSAAWAQDPRAIDVAIERGASALERLASADGGWRSETYGILKPGRALTAFVLAALAGTDRAIDPTVLEGALLFLERATTAEGSVAAGGGVLDYPNYATGFAILALVRFRPDGFEERVALMTARLERDQLAEELGWTPADPAYGGWGFGGAPRRRGDAGAAPDLSTTAVVLEALAAAGIAADSTACRRARVFGVRCQESGEAGGFLFNPADLSANKTAFLGPEGGRPAPYATATTDGIAALLLSGADPRGEPICRATDWLALHPSLDAPGGFSRSEAPRWDLGLRFYFWWSLSRAMRLLEACGAVPDGFWPGWRSEIARRLTSCQREDGTWANEVGLSREDDPLVATGFALMALAACR